MKALGALFVVLPVLMSTAAHAEESAKVPPEPVPSTEKPPEREDRRVYLSVAPFLAIIRTAELTAEFRVVDKFGVAAIGGFGKPVYSDYQFTTWNAGVQAIGYPVGHFDHGMQLAAEAQYIYASLDDGQSKSSTVITADGSGIAVGGLVGYKLATKSGFTFNVQGGASYLAMTAAAADSGGSSVRTSGDHVIPRLRINLGWSF